MLSGAPLLAALAVAVRVKLGTPILFRQKRPGLGGEPFELIKFRTMADRVDANGQPLPDAERLLPLGRWLRATSLDELPELWNVLKGDVSLNGPSPVIIGLGVELQQEIPYYNVRNMVRPGLSG